MTPFARHLPLAAAAALLLGACADVPTAPATASVPRLDPTGDHGAQRYTYDALYDFVGDSYVQFTCEDGTASERVQLFGQIFERYTFMETPSDRRQYVSSTMPVGLFGVGLVSGQEYRVVERDQSSVAYEADGPGGGSMHETWSLRALDTHETFGITYLVRWKFDESGELIVDRVKELETCKP